MAKHNRSKTLIHSDVRSPGRVEMRWLKGHFLGPEAGYLSSTVICRTIAQKLATDQPSRLLPAEADDDADGATSSTFRWTCASRIYTCMKGAGIPAILTVSAVRFPGPVMLRSDKAAADTVELQQEVVGLAGRHGPRHRLALHRIETDLWARKDFSSRFNVGNVCRRKCSVIPEWQGSSLVGAMVTGQKAAANARQRMPAHSHKCGIA